MSDPPCAFFCDRVLSSFVASQTSAHLLKRIFTAAASGNRRSWHVKCHVSGSAGSPSPSRRLSSKLLEGRKTSATSEMLRRSAAQGVCLWGRCHAATQPVSRSRHGTSRSPKASTRRPRHQSSDAGAETSIFCLCSEPVEMPRGRRAACGGSWKLEATPKQTKQTAA